VESAEERDVLLTRTRESAQWRVAVYARLGTTSKMVAKAKTYEMEKFTEIVRRLRRMEGLVKGIANSPASRCSCTRRRYQTCNTL
jgi:hypothetical protein